MKVVFAEVLGYVLVWFGARLKTTHAGRLERRYSPGYWQYIDTLASTDLVYPNDKAEK